MEEQFYTPKKKKEIKKSILLLIGVLLVFFLIFEIGLRIFSYPNYGFSKGMFEADENLGWKLSPDYSGTHSIFGRTVSINTNSKGMRDFREYAYEKGDKLRVLVLGSSYAFGNGAEFEESYVELLRQSFNEEVEIINPSVPGYIINHKYVYFMKEGIKYNPDIILVPFTPNEWGHFEVIGQDMDLAVNKETYKTVNKQGFLVPPNMNNLQKVHAFLLVKSRGYSFFYSKTRLVFSLIVNKFERSPKAPPYFFEKNSLEYQEDYDGHFLLLKKLKESTDAKIILFIAPHKIDLANEEEIKENYGINYSVNTYQTKESMKQIAKELQIEIIEINSNDPDIFLKIDGHWTPRGNKMIADELYLKLKDKL